MFTFEFGLFDWLSLFYNEWRQTSKLVYLKISENSSIFKVSAKENDFGQNLDELKLLNCIPFIKNPRGNHVYNGIWSFWVICIVLQWMKRNFKIIQFSSSLMRSGYTI